MQCLKSVAPINADLVPIAPVRDGQCGTPAPVLMSSVGSHDKVVFDPALVMNCPMVIELHRWLKDVVQPAAKAAFGSPVARVIGSSYACRTVYNEPNGHLSQHAFANAVDVPTFILVDGRKIDVAHGWGPTERDLAAQQKSKKNKSVAATDLVQVSTSTTPKDQKQATTASPDAAAQAKFLRLVLQGACQTFSTVLGPDANDVHRSHFHLDLKEGNSVKVCK